MQYLRGVYDSSSHRLMVEYKNVLLKKYLGLLSDLVKEAKKVNYLPKSTEIKKIDEESVLISLPCTIEGAENIENGERINNLPELVTDHLSTLIDTFTKKAIEEEMKEIEFIPLSGYPIDKLKEDIEQAIKDKRDLVLIDSYANYKKLANQEVLESKQCRFKYLDNDYADVAYLIHSGNVKELKKYKSRLENKSWI